MFSNSGHEDRAIVNDSDILVLDNRIIVVWGDSPKISYYSDNRVKYSIQLFSSDELPAGNRNGFDNFQQVTLERAGGFSSLQLTNYSAPKKNY